MPSSLRAFLGSCCSLRKICMRGCPSGNEESEEDELLWSQGLASHALGNFSLATVQANRSMEDQSRVESGPHGTFIGVFDGHGGPEAAKFVRNQLFAHLTRFASEDGGMSAGALCKAFEATEEGFESLVIQTWLEKPEIASMGSCCLVGVISDGILYVANLGDSRAVLGTVTKATGAAVARQLTDEHNACHEVVRRELQSLHPDDPHIVVLKHGIWRVKGLIQVSRSIGDMYLKKAEFNREPLLPKFLLAEAFEQPILLAEPSIVVHKIEPQDEFVIFASDGFWEHLSNDEAVDIVHNTSSREGIAKRLVRLALQEAAKKRETRYSDLKKLEKGVRRHFHDDITVIVVFVDHALLR